MNSDEIQKRLSKNRAHFVAMSIAILASSFSLQNGIAAGAAGDADYKAGIAAYGKKDYKVAEARFRESIKKGNKSPAVWLYSAHSFLALGHKEQAKQTYELVVKRFWSSPEAKVAAQGLEKLGVAAPVAVAATISTATKPAEAPAASGGLLDRIIVVPPQFGHAPVSPKSIAAVKAGVASLPPKMRKELDESGATINLAPNIIDRWPDTIKDLPEDDAAPTLAELPGRLYGKEIYAYERVKVRHSTALKSPRTPTEMRHTAMNCCFQVLDDMQGISKSGPLRAEYEADKKAVSPSMHDKLATFLKDDDWGPRETCAELTASMLGGGNEFTTDLYRSFPRTKAWLKAKFGIK
jgi:hypothetical protein